MLRITTLAATAALLASTGIALAQTPKLFDRPVFDRSLDHDAVLLTLLPGATVIPVPARQPLVRDEPFRYHADEPLVRDEPFRSVPDRAFRDHSGGPLRHRADERLKRRAAHHRPRTRL